jgi:hypothetical protein
MNQEKFLMSGITVRNKNLKPTLCSNEQVLLQKIPKQGSLLP